MRSLLYRSLFLLVSSIPLQAQKPNVVLILADDLGYSDIGCYGSEIETPHLDSLAAEGLRFRSFYSTGRCSPSRAALLTGRYSHEVGVGHLDNDWGTPGYRGRLDPNSPTVAETLKDAGYLTAMAGKWHLGKARPYWPIDRGFDRMFSSPDGGGYYFRPFETANRPIYDNETLVDLDDWETNSNEGEPFYCTDAFTTMGMEFIDEALAQSKPFFLYLAYIAPHWPLEAAPADVDKYLDADYKVSPATVGTGTYADGYNPVRAARFAKQTGAGGIAEALNGTAEEWTLSPQNGSTWAGNAIHEQRMALHAAVIDRMDRQIGRLLAKLDDPNGDGDLSDSVADNTIVIFVSDNGCDSGGGRTGAGNTNHPDYGGESNAVKVGSSWANVSNTPFRRFKNSNQEGGIATPCIIRWPNGITRPVNEVEPTRGHLVDIVPTLLAAAGESVPVSQPQPSGISLLPLFSAEGSVTRPAPLFFEHQGERAAIDSTGYKLFSRNNASWELYNLLVDPQELNNLASSESARRDEMESIWFNWAHDANVKDYPPLSLERITLSSPQDATHTPLQNGSFSVSSSANSSNVDVHFEIGGTASPTTHYTPLSSIYSFSGSSFQQFDIVPNTGGAIDGPRSVEVTIKPRYWYLEPANSETILIEPTTFSYWASIYLAGQAGIDATPLGDPDGDGALNFQEFGRGTDPNVSDIPNEETTAPTRTLDGEHAVFSFLRAPASSEVSHVFELSDDLETWEDATSTNTTVTDSAEGSRNRVALTLLESFSEAPRMFGRVGWEWVGGAIGDSLIHYSFTGGVASPTSAQTGVAGSDYDIRSSHFSASDSGVSGANENVFLRGGVTGATLEDAISNDDYHEVSVDFSGNSSDMISLDYTHIVSNGAFLSNIATYISTDDFATSTYLGTSTMSDEGTSDLTYGLWSLDLLNFGGTFSIRFYIFDDAASSSFITRLDDVQIYGFSSGPLVEAGPIAEYELSTSRVSTDSAGSTASSYLGGALGSAPSNASNSSVHVYTLGAETAPTAAHSFTVTPNGEPLDLTSLSFTYLATNIDFTGSLFSYELTSSATGATVLGSHSFASSVGGTPDFSSLQSIDLSSNPSLQGLSTPVTFTLTFTDNSSGTARSHGVSQMTLN